MRNTSSYQMGIDVGSTTVKIVILDNDSQINYKSYRRHQANIQQTLVEELENVVRQFSNVPFRLNITGSAGMGIGERIGIPFVQEVVAAVEVVKNAYSEKSGKTFDADLLLEDNGERSIYRFDFGKEAKA